jgi:fibronectin type 3 domain-containing protein
MKAYCLLFNWVDSSEQRAEIRRLRGSGEAREGDWWGEEGLVLLLDFGTVGVRWAEHYPLWMAGNRYRKWAGIVCACVMMFVLTGCASSGGGGGKTVGGGTTVPGVPAGLQAVAGNAQVALSWSASAGATDYLVMRSVTSGGPYAQVGMVTGTSFSDTGLVNGTKYFYVVMAGNSAGNSGMSAEVGATPVATVAVPAAPVGVSATAGNTQVVLSWSASAGAASYIVRRGTVSGGPYSQVGAPTDTTYTDSGLTNGTKYFYVVAATDSAGTSANSVEVSATPAAPVAVPAAPKGVSATAGNGQVVLSWSASAAAVSYIVRRATTNGGPYSQVGAPTAATYTDSGLTNGTKYDYVVAAVNSAGTSGNSAQVSATPTAPVGVPVAPTGVSATAGNVQVVLTWSASAGATSYVVRRATVSGGPYSQVGAPTDTTYTDSGLTNGAKYFYVVAAVNSAGTSGNSAEVNATPTAPVAADVTITVDPSSTHAISPWIYGINFYNVEDGSAATVTFDRAGGNRWTAYNWETNASNAGSDYLYENDNYLSSSNVAGEAVRSFIAGDQGNGLASLITVQMQGLVSGDENGPVSVTNPPDLTRFKTVVDKKSTASGAVFTITPVITDANVYMDEFVWALDQKFTGKGIFGSGAALPTFVELDNEPELWNSTHLEVQGAAGITSDAYITKTINLASAVKDQFPDAKIFGPVHYGFQGIYNWQGDASIHATPGGANWFPDKYLAALKTASTSYGKPLVDVYDFHWYAEEYDSSGTRSLDLTGTTLTDAQVQMIVQSPRNLWDATYTDSFNSNPWIYNELGNTPIQMVTRLQSKIAAENPGMGIALTEYESGGWNHIAGTIAQADNLGIFGNLNVFAANFWPPNGTYSYALAGFKAFRGFDGAGSHFGDTSVKATSSNVQNVVVYASTDSSKAGRVVFVAINRSTTAQVTAINGLGVSGTAQLWQMTAASAAGQSAVAPVSAGTMAVSGSSMTVNLPALSVTTIDIE